MPVRKQDEIAGILRKRIQEGIYVPGVRLPSEVILAEELGVNKVTLNKAVSRLISEGLLIRGSSTRDGTFVREEGCLIPGGTITAVFYHLDSFGTQILKGIVNAAARNNYLPVLLCPDPKNMNHAVSKARAAGTRGIIYVASDGPNDGTFPTVYVDCDLLPRKEKYFCVNCDSTHGGVMMADALLAAGHREIVYVANSQISIRENPRCFHFFKRLETAGIAVAGRFYSIAEPENIYPLLLRRIAAEHPGVTAIAAENDYIAATLRETAAELGNAFPANVTYTGFGDIQEFQRIHPFPTITQNPYELGSPAVEILSSVIEGRIPLSAPFLQEIPVELKGAERIRQLHGTG